jgi:hypothetical protein
LYLSSAFMALTIREHDASGELQVSSNLRSDAKI